MSLLPTPTFSGVAESETFYVRASAPNVSGVSSVQGIAGAVGITSTDSSITVATSGQNVNLTTTGNALAPSTVVATGSISAGTTLAVGSSATIVGSATASSFTNSSTVAQVPLTANQSGIQIVNVAVSYHSFSLASLQAQYKLARCRLGTISASSSNQSVDVQFYLSSIAPGLNNQQTLSVVQTTALWSYNVGIGIGSTPVGIYADLPTTIPIEYIPTLYLYVTASTSAAIWGYTFTSDSFIAGVL